MYCEEDIYLFLVYIHKIPFAYSILDIWFSGKHENTELYTVAQILLCLIYTHLLDHRKSKFQADIFHQIRSQ